MSGLKNLQKRLSYYGGTQQDRMIKDKLRSLEKSLVYSYQADVAIFEDGREFRCLINPNKIDMESEDKVLSIPYQHKVLNGEGIEDTGIKVGDVIQQKSNGVHWLVYLQHEQEKAYFRGMLRKCDTSIEINGAQHWVYLRGPEQKDAQWIKSEHNIFNDLNYTLELYISNTMETNEFFDRFKILKVKGKNWEVQATDKITTEGIICVYLKESYDNKYDEEAPVTQDPSPEAPEESVAPMIIGPAELHPFDIATYTVQNAASGTWHLSNNRAKINAINGDSVEIEITTGKSGSVSLLYGDLIFNIKILSL